MFPDWWSNKKIILMLTAVSNRCYTSASIVSLPIESLVIAFAIELKFITLVHTEFTHVIVTVI